MARGFFGMRGVAPEARGVRAFAPALILLTILAFISYIDRSNLSTAGHLLKDELHINASQLGILLSAFFWTYTAMQFVSGWLVDRLDANYVMVAGFFLWSLATTATGLVQGFTMLLVMRLLVGTGESVMVPAMSKIMRSNVAENQRGFANGAWQAAIRFGPAVGTLGVGVLITWHGWRPAFIGIGLVSLAWIPAWIKWMPRTALEKISREAPGFAEISGQRSFWGACVGQACSLYLLYFMLTLLPFYLVHERHLSMQSMVRIATGYYLIDGTSALATGWLADFFIQRGNSPTFVRKSAMGAGHLVASVAVIGLATADSRWYFACLVAIGIGEGIACAGVFAFSQALAGPNATGKWSGLQNGFANVAGIAAPTVTGFLVDRTGTFVAPLAITSFVMAVGGLSWLFVVGQVEQVRWKFERLMRGHEAID
jgi:ACS family D-galactonate transporter-like MFS transporter